MSCQCTQPRLGRLDVLDGLPGPAAGGVDGLGQVVGPDRHERQIGHPQLVGVLTRLRRRAPSMPAARMRRAAWSRPPRDRPDVPLATVCGPHRRRSCPADELDPELIAVGVDEGDYFLRGSRAPPRRNWTLASGFLGALEFSVLPLKSFDAGRLRGGHPDAYPSSMSTWRTQDRTDSTP